MRRRWSLLAVSVALVTSLLLAATSSLGALAATPKKVTITTAFAFKPKKITVAKNHRVKWVNDSGFLHHILFTNGAKFDRDVPIGGSVSKVFRHRGTFHYHCTIHTFMKGTVVVT